MSLRETKKAKTRKLISDTALLLFIEKGYAAVTVAEIAQKAEVAVATLFNYFPTKESIIFDLEDDIEVQILAAVRNREPEQFISDALYNYFLDSDLMNPPSKKIHSEFMKLIRSTPELGAYFRRLWSRYEAVLAKEIQTQINSPKMEAEYAATLILEAVNFACNSSSPKEALSLSFHILKSGWNK